MCCGCMAVAVAVAVTVAVAVAVADIYTVNSSLAAKCEAIYQRRHGPQPTRRKQQEQQQRQQRQQHELPKRSSSAQQRTRQVCCYVLCSMYTCATHVHAQSTSHSYTAKYHTQIETDTRTDITHFRRINVHIHTHT